MKKNFGSEGKANGIDTILSKLHEPLAHSNLKEFSDIRSSVNP